MTGYLKTAFLLVTISLAGCAATGPSRDMALSDEGYNAMVAGDMAKAESLLTEAVAENPNNPYALLNLGALYQNTDRPELARPLYQRVVDDAASMDAAVPEAQRADVPRLIQLAHDNLAALPPDEVAVEAAPEPAPEPLVEAPAPVPTPAPAPEPEPVVAFDYWVQIGAFSTMTRAERLGSQFETRHADLLGGQEVRYEQRGSVVRVQVGPYANMAEANSACRDFKRVGVNCLPKKR